MPKEISMLLRSIASPGDAKARRGRRLKFDFIKKKEIFFFEFYFYPSVSPLLLRRGISLSPRLNPPLGGIRAGGGG